KFEISKKAQVKISVFDILGKEISKLVNKEFNQGTYTIEFKGDNLASGIYFYKIEVNEFTQMKKMILMK
ncbi:MAG TPA: T9SS type A sorting domain-containing protein, partial [Flavobacterium sp.]|nr:T9SS type A sorting domain-containing protein [Flavobacterium sp.]